MGPCDRDDLPVGVVLGVDFGAVLGVFLVLEAGPGLGVDLASTFGSWTSSLAV